MHHTSVSIIFCLLPLLVSGQGENLSATFTSNDVTVTPSAVVTSQSDSADLSHCMGRCLQTVGCGALKYNSDTKLCTLFTTTSVDVINVGDVAARMTGAITTVGDHRLVGHKLHEGRMEIWRNALWGSVCDDSFTLDQGSIGGRACLAMGYRVVEMTKYASAYGLPTLTSSDEVPIHCMNPDCGAFLTFNGCCNVSGNHCGHAKDVAVRCGY